MARIVVTTFGSTGDLNPFIALALALCSRGHDVVFAVEANFQQQVGELGFPVRLLTGDQEKALASYSQQIFNNDQPLTSFKILLEHYILPTLPAKVAELRETCQQAELLIQALKTLLSTPIYVQNAREMQNSIRQEDGVATLCSAVEQVLHDGLVSPAIPAKAEDQE